MTVLHDTVVEPYGGCHHVGRGGESYRYAFKRGAKDALRIAARRLPPDMWDVVALLERLSDEYEHDPDEMVLS